MHGDKTIFVVISFYSEIDEVLKIVLKATFTYGQYYMKDATIESCYNYSWSYKSILLIGLGFNSTMSGFLYPWHWFLKNFYVVTARIRRIGKVMFSQVGTPVPGSFPGLGLRSFPGVPQFWLERIPQSQAGWVPQDWGIP